MVDRDADLRIELRAWLDTQVITSDNIGDIRRSLFVPWNSSWNGWVRDDTAERENKPSALVPLPGAAASTLHQQIVNIAPMRSYLDVPGEEDMRHAYLLGHCDARHAAAELVSAPVPSPPDGRQAEPFSAYHEDNGAVLWWHFPIDEPPYCGMPHDSEWPFTENAEIYLGWTRLTVPSPPPPPQPPRDEK